MTHIRKTPCALIRNLPTERFFQHFLGASSIQTAHVLNEGENGGVI